MVLMSLIIFITLFHTIQVTVTMPHPAADVGVTVSVLPGIQAEFDAAKVARLTRHINTIVMTIQEAMYPADSIGLQDLIQGPGGPALPLPLAPHLLCVFDSVSDASAIMDREIVTAAAKRDQLRALMGDMNRDRDRDRDGGQEGYGGQVTRGLTPSPTHCFADVTVTLPLISVELLVTDTHSVTFLISGVETHVLVRQNDVQVYFALKTLRLVDSLRGSENEGIIYTPPLSASQKALQRRHKHMRKALNSRLQKTSSSSTSTSTSSTAAASSMMASEYSENLMTSSFLPIPPQEANKVPSAAHQFGQENHSESLISLNYLGTYNRQSPLYTAYGTEVTVEFTSLAIGIDEETISRLKPFLAMLAGEMKNGTSTVPVPVNVSSSVTAPAPSPPVVAATGPTGILLTVSVGSVALSLMRSKENTRDRTQGDVRGISGPRSFSPIHSGSHEDPVPSILENAFTVELTDLFAVVDMRASLAADLQLRSFTVKDCRPVSVTYVYRDMFCRSTLGAEHNSVGHSSIDRSTRTPRTQGHTQGSRTQQEDDSDILSVVYREESKSAGTVEVELRNIASFISADSVIELVNVAMLNVTAVIAVVTVLTGEDVDFDSAISVDEEGAGTGAGGRHTPPRGEIATPDRATDSPFSWMTGSNNNSFRLVNNEYSRVTTPNNERKKSVSSPLMRQGSIREVGNRLVGGRTGSIAPVMVSTTGNKGGRARDGIDQSPVPPPFLLNAIVSVVSPRLLFLEDPESADSRAIVLRSGVSVHYCHDSKSARAPTVVTTVKETLHVSIQTLEVFALTGLIRGRPQQIGSYSMRCYGASY
jgi:hypothetical protein